VGAADFCCVGLVVLGADEGLLVGDDVGANVALLEGGNVGATNNVGADEGLLLGDNVGADEGLLVGDNVGADEGLDVALLEGDGVASSSFRTSLIESSVWSPAGSPVWVGSGVSMGSAGVSVGSAD
jgi:hypothetical protein